MQSLVILGRQPALGIAELESLYGADKLQVFGQFALIDLPPSKIDFSRLGGSVKLGEVIAEVKATAWRNLEKNLSETVLNVSKELLAGKLKLGVSAYGFKNLSPKEVERTAFNLKKMLVSVGRSTRIVVSKQLELSSAQVLHNNLTKDLGVELLVVQTNAGVFIVRTTNVQDIEGYAARDQARPKRDAKVGMLPPKLAQIIINLANPPKDAILLDPFCGTGVILQEALLMGYRVYGTDIDKRMIDYSKANIKWLNFDDTNRLLEIADATNYDWGKCFDMVATETYLGQPLSTLPPATQLAKIIDSVNQLHKKFLKNIHSQLNSGTRICLAVPAWKTQNSFMHLPVIDHLKELGYNRVKFVHVKDNDLIYFREGQIVARELLVLTKD